MRSTRDFRLSVILLVVPLVLWVPPILFFCRINGYVLDRLVLKAPGLYFVYAALSFCPLAAIFVGWRLVRTGPNTFLGRTVMTVGCLLLIAFLAVLGIPLAKNVLEEKTPKIPSTPRLIEPLVGLPVFPGAEGFGTRTPAGRGGKVIEVTSLADNGAGTLRAALDEPNPRIIVFRTGGTIELESELHLDHPFVTIAGQTAPGDGICLKNCGLIITTHDVLVQHIRVRPGNEGNVDADDNDAIKILGRHGSIRGARNVVLDHISASWSEDEVISTWFGAREITICWSIIGEALNRSRHRKGTHSAGLLIGDSSDHVSAHHNLLVHNSFRNPLVIDGGTHDAVNNVIYNWGDIPGQIVDTDSNSFLNFVGNYYLPGPSSELPNDAVIVEGTSGTPQIYVEGNLSVRRPTEDVDEWAVVTQDWGGEPAPQAYRSLVRFPTPRVSTWSPEKARELVLSEAGATRPRRDPVDKRLVEDVTNQSGAVIDSPAQVGGYPELATGTPALDSDRDGMPDSWEQQMGLDPNDSTDASRPLEAGGYTNIELYLHSLLQSERSQIQP